MFTQITNYAELARLKMLQQYKDLTKFPALLMGVGGMVQVLENAVWGLIAQTNVATASGQWLDYLGAIVGELRYAATDSEYRNFIRARIQANISEGKINDVLAVLKAWNGGNLPTYALTELLPICFELVVSSTSTEVLIERLRRLVRDARSAGIGGSLIYQIDVDASTFTFSATTSPVASVPLGFDDAASPGAGGRLRGAWTA